MTTEVLAKKTMGLGETLAILFSFYKLFRSEVFTVPLVFCMDSAQTPQTRLGIFLAEHPANFKFLVLVQSADSLSKFLVTAQMEVFTVPQVFQAGSGTQFYLCSGLSSPCGFMQILNGFYSDTWSVLRQFRVEIYLCRLGLVGPTGQFKNLCTHKNQILSHLIYLLYGTINY
jgi:hypothetical protein